MDEYSRVGWAAIALALQDIGWEEGSKLPDFAVFASTVSGCLETDLAYYETMIPEGGKLASPNLFAYTLSNIFLGEAALQFGLTGAGFVFHEPKLSGLPALTAGLLALEQNQAEAALVGVCEIAPSVLSEWNPGTEWGSVFFVLQREGEARPSPYGLLEWVPSQGMTFEGRKIEDLFSLAELCTSTHRGG